jgi:hypothetical protein
MRLAHHIFQINSKGLLAMTNTASPQRRDDSSLTADTLRAYQKMLLFLFIATLSIIIFLFCMALVWKQDQEPSIFLIVVLFGTLGAFFSVLSRLYKFANLPLALQPNTLISSNFFLFIYSMVPALIGAIAAAVIYLAFASNLLDGVLFPKFACAVDDALPAADQVCDSLSDLIDSYLPDKSSDYAKTMFWGFLAGFAERLVPDLLVTFAKSQNTDL